MLPPGASEAESTACAVKPPTGSRNKTTARAVDTSSPSPSASTSATMGSPPSTTLHGLATRLPTGPSSISSRAPAGHDPVKGACRSTVPPTTAC